MANHFLPWCSNPTSRFLDKLEYTRVALLLRHTHVARSTLKSVLEVLAPPHTSTTFKLIRRSRNANSGPVQSPNTSMATLRSAPGTTFKLLRVGTAAAALLHVLEARAALPSRHHVSQESEESVCCSDNVHPLHCDPRVRTDCLGDGLARKQSHRTDQEGSWKRCGRTCLQEEITSVV